MSDQDFNLHEIDWENLPDWLFEGSFRSGVPQRLRQYIQTLRNSGRGRQACAAHVGLSYPTVITHRGRVSVFEDLENAAEQARKGKLDDKMYELGCDDGNVQAARTWYTFEGDKRFDKGKDSELKDVLDLDKLEEGELEMLRTIARNVKRREGGS
jgi:hypothetical protein